MKQNKKQTLESTQYELEISFKDKVFTGNSLLKSAIFYFNNENCCEGQHISSISNAAAVKNRVYLGKKLLLFARVFQMLIQAGF